MAQIFDIQAYRVAKQLKAFSRRAFQVTSECALQRDNLEKLFVSIKGFEGAFESFVGKLDLHRMTLQRSLSFACSCSDALELKTTDEMIKARDKILQSK